MHKLSILAGYVYYNDEFFVMIEDDLQTYVGAASMVDAFELWLRKYATRLDSVDDLIVKLNETGRESLAKCAGTQPIEAFIAAILKVRSIRLESFVGP